VKLRIVWVGKTRDANLAALADDYGARVQRFLPLEIVELKDPKRISDEAIRILGAVDSADRVVALDPRGKAWDTEQFATFFARHMREDARRLTFVIGGFSGLSASVKERADILWSLSPLTFTHDLTRVLLLEQIYRALSIIHNHPYSK
jgi:23S rRNA (pseudouridine1915-N3)-methyltransferase